MNCANAKLLLWGLALLPSAGEPVTNARPSPAENGQAEPAVSVKIRDEANIAFREHRGPYWTVGPEFTRLRQYMDDCDLTAPMFARFLNRPGTVHPTDLQTEIGFFAPASHRPDSSFKTEELRPQMVAYMVLGDRIDSKAKDLARIRHWISENGYEVDGPIMEIYHAYEKDHGATRWETEVQVPVAKRRSGMGSPKIPPPAPGTSVDQLDNRDGERPELPAASVSTMNSHTDLSVPQDASPTPVPATEMLEPHKAGGGPEMDPDMERMSPTASDGVDMIMSGDTKAFAAAVMPGQHATNGFDPVWRGHVGLRMIGILRGIEKLYPNDASWAGKFGQALADAFDSYASGLPANPKDQAVVTYGSPPQQVLQAEKEIMRALDGLLIRVGMRAAGPDDVKSELGSIVDRLTASTITAP